jgi:hypothetical protein
LGLVQAKADEKPSGIISQGRIADDPLHAIEVDDVGCSPIVTAWIIVAGHFSADKASVVRIVGEVCAVPVHNRERSPGRNIPPSEGVGEPIQAESGYNDAAEAGIIAEERQREMKDVTAGLSTNREFSDCKCTGSQNVGEEGPSGRGRGLMIVGHVAERAAVYVDHDKADEPRISLLDLGEVSIASFGVLRLYRWKLRQRNQGLMNPLNGLLLLCRGEFSQVESVTLHFDLACAAQVELVVRLDPDRRQQRDSHQHK